MNIKKIRNFCIIAHIDHGKSTLADRILELTKTIDDREMKNQVLDFLDIERERNITIKLSSVRIEYDSPGRGKYQFNLIDTPGHVDFTYEVSRSVAACEGALLIVDATQGIQAQTLSNAYLALEQDLNIIPVINKIDLPNANVDFVKKQLKDILGFDPNNAILISAKTGQNINAVLEAIIDKIPAPTPLSEEQGTKGIVFDSYYDSYRGGVLFVRLFNGSLKTGDKIMLMSSKSIHQISALGVKTNKEIILPVLETGEVGWVAAGIKNINEINIGDTVTTLTAPASTPLPGYKSLKPMVYCSLFPVSSYKYEDLKNALIKISLTDASLKWDPENSQALGFGFRCGFLGLLHMEVIQHRLENEYNLELIATAPSVKYQINLSNGNTEYISNPAHWLKPQLIQNVLEPVVLMKIFTTEEYIGGLMELCHRKRGIYKNLEYIGGNRRLLIFEMPLNEIIFDFFSKLKSISKGYASFEYDFLEYRSSKLVKVDILLNGTAIDALSIIVHRDFAYYQGRQLCLKLKSLIPKENFEVPIQAAINQKIIARETIKATRKNVTAGLYGGDITRKKKVLARQKKGKKHLKMVGKVRVPQEAFLAILKLEDD